MVGRSPSWDVPDARAPPGEVTAPVGVTVGLPDVVGLNELVGVPVEEVGGAVGGEDVFRSLTIT